MKPLFVVLWVLSIALAIGLTRFAEPDQGGSGSSVSLDEAFAEMDPLRRAFLTADSLQNVGRGDLGELQDVFETRSMGLMTEEVRLLMLVWVRFDAPGAYAWASEGPTNWRKTLTGQCLWAWGYHDGPEAMRFVAEIEDPELVARLRQNAIEGWMRSDDKKGVTDFVASYEDMGPRGRLTFVLAGEIVMAEGIDGAMRWVDALPDDTPNELKRIVFNHVAKIVAGEDDPERAAEWFLEHRAHAFTDKALEGIVRRWVQHHDRPAAFAWLLNMSDDGDNVGQRDDAVSAGFRSWMQLDPDSAQAWLLSMVPNAALDPAILEASKRLTPTDIGAAMAWAQRVDDESDRDAELARVGARWNNTDRETFQAWLSENELSDEVQRKIRMRAQPQAARMNINPKPAAARKP